LFLFLSPFLYVPYTSAEEEEEEEDEECLKTRFYSTGFGAEREELLLFFFFSLRGFLSSRISPGAAVGNACLRRSPVLLLEMRLCLTQLERNVGDVRGGSGWKRGEAFDVERDPVPYKKQVSEILVCFARLPL
jgi:hypothetical protein